MTDPDVSVLMAVYDGGEFLDEAVGSIVGQTFRDWEMVVVDDASTDGTTEKLQAWSQRDTRIRIVSNATNKGQTTSLNEGLRACRGTWIARQDADDVSSPARLARQMSYLHGHPSTVLLGTQGVLIDARGKRVGLLDLPCSRAGIAWCAPFLNPFLHTAVVFHRETALAAGGYDESFRIAQDYELWTRLAAEKETANLPQRLVRYRRTGGSLSRAGEEAAFAETDRVSDREVRRIFGRGWSQEESRLTRAFRRGLPAHDQRDFSRTLASLEAEFVQRHPIWAIGPRSLRAAWHLRLAGSAGPGLPALAQIGAALRADPRFTMRWIKDRQVGCDGVSG
jgi:glycosyltransferase involved in cell wall biosynthesis